MKESILTLILSSIVSFKLLKLKPFVSKIIFFISIMQAIDIILWYSIQTKNLKLNKLVSKYCIPIILSMQLVGIYKGSLYRNLFYEIILCYFLFIFLYWQKLCKFTIKNNNGYLKWCDIEINNIVKIIYLLLIIYPIYRNLSNGFDKDIILLSIFITFLYNFNDDAFGSKWCYSANIMSILIFLNSPMLEIN